MKVAVLTSNKDRHLFFANQVLEAFSDSIVICQSKGVVTRKIKFSKRIKRYTGRMLEVVRNFPQRKEINAAYQRFRDEKSSSEKKFFSDNAIQYRRKFSNKTYFVNVGINHKWVELVLREFKPDVVCVMGTALVKPNIFEIPKLCLNLHTGISPAYRGSASNLWPLIFNEPQYVGSTIHVISQKIDGGKIVYHVRPKFESTDNFGTLNCKSIVLGADAMIKAIQEFEADKFRSVEQWGGGKLLISDHYRPNILLSYYQNLNSGLIDRYIHFPQEFPVDDKYKFFLERDCALGKAENFE